jgi:hypothetical protein
VAGEQELQEAHKGASIIRCSDGIGSWLRVEFKNLLRGFE